MNAQTAQFLVDASLHCGSEANLYPKYLGRKMYVYGATTTGVVVKSTEDLLECVLQYVQDEGKEKLDKINLSDNIKVDNLGKNVILY